MRSKTRQQIKSRKCLAEINEHWTFGNQTEALYILADLCRTLWQFFFHCLVDIRLIKMGLSEEKMKDSILWEKRNNLSLAY